MSGPTTWSHSSSTRMPSNFTSTSSSSSSSTSSSNMTPSSTAPSLQPTTRGIDLGGWSVRVTSGPIGSSAEMDALSDILGIPPPEMAFPHNSLVLHHAESGFSLCFDAVRTLRSIDGVQKANRLYGIDCRDSAVTGGKGAGRSKSNSSVPGVKPKAKTSSSIKVAYAKEWGKSRTDFVAPTPAQSSSASADTAQTSTPASSAANDASGGGSHFGVSTADITAAKDYDWTYSSTWPGSLGDVAPQSLLPTQATPVLAAGLKPLPSSSSASSLKQEQAEKDWFQPGSDPVHDRIPVERLGPSSGEPILFYDDIVLYEDELADNGSSIVNVKVRVMPSGFLVLQRFFLRVDDVVFRIFDTRLYCQFEPTPVPKPLSTSTSAATWTPTTTTTTTTAGGLPIGSLGQLSLGTPRTASTARPRDNDVIMSSSTSSSKEEDEDDDEAAFCPRLIRECSGSQASYALVRSHLPAYKPHDLSPLTDINWVNNTLTKISRSKMTSYHSQIASGTTLPRLSDKDSSPGAKFLSPTTMTSTTSAPAAATNRYTGFPGTRPGERLDLSPARLPFTSNASAASGGAQIVGQLPDQPNARVGGDGDGDGEGLGEEWQGCGARVDVAILRPRNA